jgi:hypothetical protein
MGLPSASLPGEPSVTGRGTSRLAEDLRMINTVIGVDSSSRLYIIVDMAGPALWSLWESQRISKSAYGVRISFSSDRALSLMRAEAS